MSQEQVTVFALTDLAEAIGATLEESFPDPIWVVGVVASLSVSGKGHAYLDLTDTQIGADGKTRTARFKAIIWNRQYGVIAHQFLIDTGTALRSGIKLQCLIQVTYSSEYGLSLTITHVDTQQAVIEAQRKIDQVTTQLVALGLTGRQAQVTLPALCRRLAVISSETAAGFEDFVHQLSYNRAGYAYDIKLFPSLMQGAGTVAGVVSALDRIAALRDEFDAVVIIRGGGAEVDLFAFDDLAIGQAIACCPLPVIVGIGHARDRTVPDVVAHLSVKTPTAAAEALIERHALAEQALLEALARLDSEVDSWLITQEERLSALGHRLDRAMQAYTSLSRHQLIRADDRVQTAWRRAVQGMTHRLDLLSQRLEAADPAHMLDLGYTRLIDRQGNAIRRVAELAPGQRVLAPLSDGVVGLDVVGPVRVP